jgi:hypothetical protein
LASAGLSQLAGNATASRGCREHDEEYSSSHERVADDTGSQTRQRTNAAERPEGDRKRHRSPEQTVRACNTARCEASVSLAGILLNRFLHPNDDQEPMLSINTVQPLIYDTDVKPSCQNVPEEPYCPECSPFALSKPVQNVALPVSGQTASFWIVIELSILSYLFSVLFNSLEEHSLNSLLAIQSQFLFLQFYSQGLKVHNHVAFTDLLTARSTTLGINYSPRSKGTSKLSNNRVSHYGDRNYGQIRVMQHMSCYLLTYVDRNIRFRTDSHAFVFVSHFGLSKLDWMPPKKKTPGKQAADSGTEGKDEKIGKSAEFSLFGLRLIL